MNKRKNDLLIELLVCIIAAVAFVIFVGVLRTHEPAKIPDEQILAMRPTAGITLYMGQLAHWSLELNKPTDEEIAEIENFVATVMAAEKEEQEAKEVENAYRESLTRYFGYVPSDDELELWMRIVMAECGYTEPDEGIAAVADCVANRVRSGKFPNTITEVVYQRNQFETVTNGSIWKYQVTDRVLDICSDCIAEGVTYDYLFFTAGHYNPSGTPGGVIGHHYFSY